MPARASRIPRALGSARVGQLPDIAGIRADRSGSYRLVTLVAAFAALESVFFALAIRPAPPSRPDVASAGGRSDG